MKDNDRALREDNAPIYGEILPVKAFLLKSKISKLLKFAISTPREMTREIVSRENI